MAQRPWLERHLLGLQDARQVIDDMALRHLLEVELQAARQHRHRIFCGSVVARMNLTCLGGSSSVFSMALKACPVSM